MIIGISYDNKILVSKEVTYPDNGDALTWMIKIFRQEFNLDISNYSLKQLKREKNSIIIELNRKDLENWRNNRLNDLGI
jgi:hypothetical protein